MKGDNNSRIIKVTCKKCYEEFEIFDPETKEISIARKRILQDWGENIKHWWSDFKRANGTAMVTCTKCTKKMA